MNKPENIDKHMYDIERLAHHKAWQLVKSRRIARDDEEDVAQELLMYVLKAWPRLSQTDFTPIGFARLVIRQKTCNVLRRRSRRKAQIWNFAQPVNMKHNDPSGTGTHDPMLHHLEQADVVASLLEELPPTERDIAHALMHNDAAETAKQLGLSKHQMAKRLMSIRECYQGLLRQT